MEVSLSLFCGLPGAGKTTFAKYLCSQPWKDSAFILVSYDSILPNVRHNETNDGEISAWKAARTCILKNVDICISAIKCRSSTMPTPQYGENSIDSQLDQIFMSVEKALTQHRAIVFVIDDNMHYRGMRYEYFQICRKYSVGFSVVYFDVSQEQCLQNNMNRIEIVPHDIIKKLSSHMEIPGNSNSCKWEKYVCSLTFADLLDHMKGSEMVMDVIKKSIADPPLPLSETSQEEFDMSRLKIRKSFIHQADLCMRKFISTEIESAKKDSCDIKILGKKLASMKTKLLSIMKVGYVDEDCLFDVDGIVNMTELQRKVDHLMRYELNQR